MLGNGCADSAICGVWRSVGERLERTGKLRPDYGGVSGYMLSSSTDAEGNNVITITIDGRAASGPPELFLSAIEDVKQNIPITQALESREMFD